MCFQQADVNTTYRNQPQHPNGTRNECLIAYFDNYTIKCNKISVEGEESLNHPADKV